VHPNYHATQYVWEKLVGACMTEPTKELMKEIAEINLAYQHKPFNHQSQQHQHFLKNYLDKTLALTSQYPQLNFEKEINYFQTGLGL
jgi:hypothetical protein